MSKKTTAVAVQGDNLPAGYAKSFDKLLKATTTKKFGTADVFMTADTMEKRNNVRISTMAMQLDAALGGGIPCGGMTEIYGAESSGKTFTALRTVAAAQKKGIACIWIDAENKFTQYTVMWARKLGVDTSKLIMLQPENMQQTINTMVSLFDEGSAAFDGDILVVLDSLAALQPTEMIDADAYDQTMAMQARYWSTQFPKIVRQLRRTNSTLICINQIRSGMDKYNPEVTPGGNAPKHYAICRIRCASKVDQAQKALAADNKKFNTLINYRVMKNHSGVPLRKATFTFRSDGYIDEKLDVLEALVQNEDLFVPVQLSFDKNGNEIQEEKAQYFTYFFRDGDLKVLQKEQREAGDEVTPDEASGLCIRFRKKIVETLYNYPEFTSRVRETSFRIDSGEDALGSGSPLTVSANDDVLDIEVDDDVVVDDVVDDAQPQSIEAKTDDPIVDDIEQFIAENM